MNNIPFSNYYFELLKFNTSNIDVAYVLGKDSIEHDLSQYFASLLLDQNYETNPTTWDTITPGYKILSQDIVGLVFATRPSTVLEIGAGSGLVAKEVYNNVYGLNMPQIMCVEANKTHYDYMKRNLKGLNIKLHNESAHNLESFGDSSVEFVYTNTVMMHIPYLVEISIIMELARISSNWILHNENTVSCVVHGNMQEFYINDLMVDYKNIYDKLGFDMVLDIVKPYPHEAPHKYHTMLFKRRQTL